MDNNSNREKIEWLNYWIENANKRGEKRIILLGDSVTRELRKKLSFYMHEDYAVDLLAMSYNIFDDMVLEEIKHFFQTSIYQYDVVIFQMGVHHGSHIQCADSVEDTSYYEIRCIELLRILKQYAGAVIAMASTLESDMQEGKRRISCEYKKEIEKRNKLLENAAVKLDIVFYDINEKMNYFDARFTDRFHFYEIEYENIAKHIIRDLFPDVEFVTSNQIETLQELEEKLNQYKDKKIYIYGNGIRGKRIKKYLEMQNYVFGGFIVSKGYEEVSENTVDSAQIEIADSLIIVTPIDVTVWKRLDKQKADYISIHSDIHTFLRMYIDMPL